MCVTLSLCVQGQSLRVVTDVKLPQLQTRIQKRKRQTEEKTEDRTEMLNIEEEVTALRAKSLVLLCSVKRIAAAVCCDAAADVVG